MVKELPRLKPIETDCQVRGMLERDMLQEAGDVDPAGMQLGLSLAAAMSLQHSMLRAIA